MPTSELIVKDNALINASYNLDTVEQRLILLAILQARETKTGIDANTRLRIHASDYMSRFNVSKHAAYKALKTAVTNLFGRQFSYQTIDEKTGKSKKVISRWVQNISYIDDAATLEVTFTMDVVPLITRLEKQFTSYQLKHFAEKTAKPHPYISNGAFIAAAYFLGFTVKRINDGPNAYINISSKTVTPIRAAVGYD